MMFTYLGKVVTNQDLIHEKTKSRLSSDNASYQMVQSLLSSCIMTKNRKIKISEAVILHVVLYRCESWSLTLRQEHRQTTSENGALRNISGPKRLERNVQ
jgi:hypothetical protein